MKKKKKSEQGFNLGDETMARFVASLRDLVDTIHSGHLNGTQQENLLYYSLNLAMLAGSSPKPNSYSCLCCGGGIDRSGGVGNHTPGCRLLREEAK